jgi:hypothetical protein
VAARKQQAPRGVQSRAAAASVRSAQQPEGAAAGAVRPLRLTHCFPNSTSAPWHLSCSNAPRNAHAKHLDAPLGDQAFIEAAARFLRDCAAAQIQLAPAVGEARRRASSGPAPVWHAARRGAATAQPSAGGTAEWTVWLELVHPDHPFESAPDSRFLMHAAPPARLQGPSVPPTSTPMPIHV